MITFVDVTFRYPGAEGRPALSDVSLTLAPGELVAVVGSNGSGKSTLARLCDGLLVPTEGTVTVDGMDTRDEACTWNVRSRVGLVGQNPDDQIVGTVVEEDVAFGPENLGVPRDEIRRRVDAALEEVGLAGLQCREPHLLSEGQKQRLAIAGALALDSVYLVVDEPVAMLDAAGRRDVLALLDRLVRRQGRGVLHVTHRVDDAARADRILALKDGAVTFAGKPEALLGDSARMAEAGLTGSQLAALASRLRALGIQVPADAHTPAQVVGAL
jgi:energy-coupling factor transport system ATP-binding protein